MIKAVLLDLDGALLNINRSQYFTATLDRLGRFFNINVPDVLLPALGALRVPRDVTTTNTQLILEALAPHQRVPMTELPGALKRFYSDAVPTLRPTPPSQGNAALVEQLQSRGIAVVILGNAIYPQAAVEQHLEWAGLSPKLGDYAFVAHADNMHFLEPDAAYYIEVLARVGVEPSEAVVVGREPGAHINPAHCVGLTTFHIHGDADPSPVAGKSGTLTDFAKSIDDGWLDQIVPYPLQPQMIEPELQGNMGALFGLLAEVKPHQWAQHPDPDEWSILQVICHLLQREAQVQRPRLKRIATEDNPFLTPPPEPAAPDERTCPDGMEVARAFVGERLQTLTFLRSLSLADWQRPARHSIFSNTTLLEMAHFTAQHDRMHITQVCQTLGKCD